MRFSSYNLIGIQASALVLLCAFFACAPTVSAADLTVTPQSDPLISLSSLVPGAGVSRTLTVTNNSTETQDVFVAVANENDNGLAPALQLSVSDAATTYFDDLFSTFFISSNVALGVLPAGDSRVYTLTVSMPSNASSAFQGTSLSFDLLVGFEGTGDTVVVSGSGGGGGGGGGVRSRISDSFGMGGANVENVLPGPTPQILGEQVSVIPVGAPNTGVGASQPLSLLPLLLSVLLLIFSIPYSYRATRAN